MICLLAMRCFDNMLICLLLPYADYFSPYYFRTFRFFRRAAMIAMPPYARYAVHA